MSSAGRSVSPCFQYSAQSLGRDRFRFISPYTTARLDKRQKIFSHTDIVLHSANTSKIQATKKPHNYHKIAVWQKDDRIRKSPLKFCVYYYSELEGDCQASIITELWRLSVVFCVTLWHMIHGSLTPQNPLRPVMVLFFCKFLAFSPAYNRIYNIIDIVFCRRF